MSKHKLFFTGILITAIAAMSGCTKTEIEIVVPDISVPVAAPSDNSSSTEQHSVPSVKSSNSATPESSLSSAGSVPSSTEPALSSTKPASSSTKPASSSTKPASSSTEPALSSTKPASSSTKSAPSSTEPAPSSTKPTQSSTKQTPNSIKPALSSTKPQSTSTVSSENPPEDNPTSIDGVIFSNNIAIVGTRAMSLYGANPNNFKKYAEAINKYKEALPDVNVYSIVVPVACEYYAPPEIKSMSASQLAHINIVNKNLVGVQAVDAYSALAQHVDEDIYLRTDHHWAPLGGYYAAQEFAKAADVPFLPLSDYVKHVNKGYCGTMYDYSGENEILKNNPEDFVYHVPKTVNWTTTYINYKISGWDVIGADEPIKAAYFLDYGDNGSYNYCTFMAGDAKIVHVETSTKNGRKLAIIKDSFGNAIPGYLFGSFEEIYVMDLRFFSHNMIDYIQEKGITDLLFVNNTTIAGNKAMSDNLDTIRTQEDMGF